MEALPKDMWMFTHLTYPTTDEAKKGWDMLENAWYKAEWHWFFSLVKARMYFELGYNSGLKEMMREVSIDDTKEIKKAFKKELDKLKKENK